MKSKIIKKLSINFEKEMVVDQVFIDRDEMQFHQKRLTELFKDLPKEEQMKRINDELKIIILKNNFFNKIMEFITPYYEFDLDPEEVAHAKEQVKQNYPSRKDDVIEMMAERAIEKQLIYDDIQNQFHVKLTQDQIDKMLEGVAKQANDTVENIKKDEPKYIALVSILQTEYTTSYLLNRFPLRVNLPFDWNTQQIMLFRLPPGVVPAPSPNPNNAAAPTNDKKPA